MRLTRRSLLAGMACAAPFVPLLPSHAGGSPPPKRLVLVFTANGTITDAWRPASGSGSDFTFGRILEPLAPYQDQIIQLSGLQIVKGGPGGQHAQGVTNLWTAGGILEGDLFESGNGDITGWGAGTSVDQFLAQDATTPYKSLEFAVSPGEEAELNSRTIYAGPNQPVAPESNPITMFDRLFADSMTDPEQLERIRAQQQSVIDVVKDELDFVRGKVASEDKMKIDAHLEGVFELERRLTTPLAECELPGTMELEPPFDFTVTGAAQTELLVKALQCDLTRIASLQWSKAVSHKTFDWLGHTEDHHDLSHMGDSNTDAQEQLVEINHWYAEQFAALIGALAATPEGDGTMLDNTMVVWGNELGKGNSHSLNGIPFIIAGGGAGALRSGQALHLSGMEHNRLLVSICHAMDRFDVDSYGDTDTGSGAISEILTT